MYSFFPHNPCGDKMSTGAENHNSTSDLSSAKQKLIDMEASMASLCNIGNSCYMNSVLYSLRFTPSFLHSLHHLVDDCSQILSAYEAQIKLKKNLTSSVAKSSSPALENIKTAHQIAMEELHDLFKNLTSNEMADQIEPHRSDQFNEAIQNVNPMFEGMHQQDAHELLMCILDSIRESSQTAITILKNLPYRTASDDLNASDAAVETQLLQNERTNQKRMGAMHFFRQYFEGVTTSSIKCLTCETTTEQTEQMIDLSVPITDSSKTPNDDEFFIQVIIFHLLQSHSDNKILPSMIEPMRDE